MAGIYSRQTFRRPPVKRRSAFVQSTSVIPRHNKKQEESIQIRISRYVKKTYPQVVLIGDFAAGMDLTDNQRIRMMAMRSEDGQPDISIDYPSTHILPDGRKVTYHGLRIELKKEGTVLYKKDGTLRSQKYKRRLKNGQLKIGDHLRDQSNTLMKYNKIGYFARFAIGYDAAKRMIDWYMHNEQSTLF